MAEHQLPKKQDTSDEIDLGQLLNLIRKGFTRIFEAILRMFLYLKKHALILIGLAILGIAIGFGLNQIVSKKHKTEVIVKPNLESKNYLYDVVDEIQANIKAKDTLFFRSLDIDVERLNGFEVTVEPLEAKNGRGKLEEEMKYLELLQNFENTNMVADVVRAEILNKSSLNHRITFYYKDTEIGSDYSKKLMTYINSNSFFSDLIVTYKENAIDRIEKNQELLEQVDNLVSNYSEKLIQKQDQSNEGRIILDNEEKLDITGLLELKNTLIRDTERKKLELKEQSEPISIINFGKMQQVQKPFFGKNIILFPVILIVVFFFISFLKYLNRKSKEIRHT